MIITKYCFAMINYKYLLNDQNNTTELFELQSPPALVLVYLRPLRLTQCAEVSL